MFPPNICFCSSILFERWQVHPTVISVALIPNNKRAAAALKKGSMSVSPQVQAAAPNLYIKVPVRRVRSSQSKKLLIISSECRAGSFPPQTITLHIPPPGWSISVAPLLWPLKLIASFSSEDFVLLAPHLLEQTALVMQTRFYFSQILADKLSLLPLVLLKRTSACVLSFLLSSVIEK